MYECKFCGNTENFIEHNIMANEVKIVDGELEQVREEFIDCIEVICGKCNKQIIEEGEQIDE